MPVLKITLVLAFKIVIDKNTQRLLLHICYGCFSIKLNIILTFLFCHQQEQTEHRQTCHRLAGVEARLSETLQRLAALQVQRQHDLATHHAE